MTITIAHFTTISGHFSANCMFIFHKKEVQTVILRCLTGLNIDWFKNYGLRCKWRPRACLANFQNIATDKSQYALLAPTKKKCTKGNDKISNLGFPRLVKDL